MRRDQSPFVKSTRTTSPGVPMTAFFTSRGVPPSTQRAVSSYLYCLPGSSGGDSKSAVEAGLHGLHAVHEDLRRRLRHLHRQDERCAHSSDRRIRAVLARRGRSGCGAGRYRAIRPVRAPAPGTCSTITGHALTVSGRGRGDAA